MFFEYDDRYPRRWGEMSFEFKCFFVYHVTMMAMLLLQGMLTTLMEAGAACTLLTIFSFLSVRRRRLMQWYWPGIGLKEIAGCMATIALLAVFVIATTPPHAPFNSGTLPFYLILGGFAVFGVLGALKFVYTSERSFLLQCYGNTADAQDKKGYVNEAPWKKIVRTAFRIAFLLVWLEGMAFFYFFNQGVGEGSPVITATQTERLVNHSQVVFITPEHKARIDALEKGMAAGIPSVLMLSLLLQYFIGGIFPNMITRAQRQNRD